ncbi:ExeA family protein [Paragemmobacter ruber]|uniref:AAA family ATPase n=1 Tax=Paragemmobacter ruber TaxID=1985673 RepID=A0ABW9Y3I6_9RHOB|nr:AAA family ATPase [Rhodobacter ruber]NBE06499.1 AAA family ATPase [Rhodobacter ruber]
MGSILDIYTGYFGLSARPFAIAPDPDMLYWSNAHRRAYSLMEYAIVTRAPITLVTGEVGSGKTLLVQHLLRNVGDDVVFGLVSQVRGKAEDVLPWVLLALGEPAEPEDTMVDLFSRFEERLIREYAAGRRVVLVFDEAQNLSDTALEQIRTLTNMNTGTDELLQVFLVGHSSLKERIVGTILQPLAQRIGAACHLPAMDAETTGEYVRHRLRSVGGNDDIFTDDAVDLVHEHSGGLARLVNQLCDFSMVYAFSKGNPQVDDLTVMQVINDGVFFAGQALLPPAAREEVMHIPVFRSRATPQD